MAKHVEVWQWFESKIDEMSDFLQNVWFSDEAHFSIRQKELEFSKNSVFWRAQALGKVLQRPLRSVECTTWVAISKHGIIGLFWFENDVGETVVVNKEHCS